MNAPVERIAFGDGTPAVSVITVFNRRDVLEKRLLASLERQAGIAFEWIGVDNSQRVHVGAAAALNAGAATAQGDTLLFVHQDVELYGDTWLHELHGWMTQLPRVGVAGVIGRDAAGAFTGYMLDRTAMLGTPIAAALKVQTLDECVLAVPRQRHVQRPFDEQNTSWHVYGVDACLAALRDGLDVFVLPLFVHHDSGTSNLKGLATAHRWIYGRHGAVFGTIHTTCGSITSATSPLIAAVRGRIARVVRAAASAAGLRQSGRNPDRTA